MALGRSVLRTDWLAPAADVVDFWCCYESRIGAADAADDGVRRPRRGAGDGADRRAQQIAWRIPARRSPCATPGAANSASLALSRLALLKSLLKFAAPTTFSAVYARAKGAASPWTRLALLKWASEIGGVTHTVWRRHDLAAAARGAARRDRTDPHQPPVRRGERAACAGCRRFPVGHGLSG